MKKDIFLFMFLVIFSYFSTKTYSKQEEFNSSIKELIEKDLMRPIRLIHDSMSIMKMFDQAYTLAPVWKYTLLQSPSGNRKFYLFQLREYRGAFVVDQVKFRVYESMNVEVEDWEQGKFIPVTEWLKTYKKK